MSLLKRVERAGLAEEELSLLMSAQSVDLRTEEELAL